MTAKNEVSRRGFLKTAAKRTAGIAAAGAIGAPAILSAQLPSETINVGCVGVGIRGYSLMQDVQDITNVRIIGISDLYDSHIDRAVKRCNNPDVYVSKDYRRLIDDKDIDVIVQAAPDHWHAQINIDAFDAGKDVYGEKCMVHTLQEAKDMVKVCKRNKAVFQLGHNLRSLPIHQRAKEILYSGVLGKVTLIKACHNRNSIDTFYRFYGAYRNFVKPADADEQHIDWQRFLGSAPKRPFSSDRFFHWRLYWDYGEGVAGDLMSHAIDSVNQMYGMGIPKTCIASGGLYYWKDDREITDVWNAIFEYPDKNLSINYECSCMTTHDGTGAKFFGKEGTLDVGISEANLYLEPIYPKNQEIIERTKNKLREKGYHPIPNKPPILTYTNKEAFGYKSHMKDFFDCVRNRTRTRCNEDDGFEITVIVLMSMKSFMEKRMVTWDPLRQEIV